MNPFATGTSAGHEPLREAKKRKRRRVRRSAGSGRETEIRWERRNVIRVERREKFARSGRTSVFLPR